MSEQFHCPSEFVFLCGAHIDQIIRLDAAPVPGVSNPGKIETSPGGAALNSASIAAALGLKVTLVSPVGDDANGALLKDVCRQRGISTCLVIEDSMPTGIYSAVFDPAGDIVIGAADLGIYDRINLAWLDNHLPTGKGLFINANLSGRLLGSACRKAEFVAAATISPAKAPRLLPILENLDLLFTNLREAQALCGGDGDAGYLARWLHGKGVRSGIISNGANPLTSWHGEIVTETPVRPVENLVDVNGAGDALAGALLAGLGTGLAMEGAIQLGLETAATSLAHSGPYWPQIRQQNARA